MVIDAQVCRALVLFDFIWMFLHTNIKYVFQTGRSRGFAFIYFESMEDAKAAKESCNGIEIDGRRIRVDFSITQRAHTPTPGIYMGKPTYDDSYEK